MPGIDQSIGRVIAALALLIVAAVSLHGYLPGATRPAHEESTSSPAALTVVVALLGVSLGIVAVAVIGRVREPRAIPASSTGADATSSRSRDGKARPTARALLVTVGVLGIGLLIMVLLALIFLLLAPEIPQVGFGQPASETGSSPAMPGSVSEPLPPRQPGEPSGTVLGYLGAGAVIFLLMLSVGTLAASRQQRRVAKTDAAVGDYFNPSVRSQGPESLMRAAELGLVEIRDVSREPRKAIIACYVAMEHALAASPKTVPQDCDTPSEVLSRAIEQHAVHTASATQLVELFAEARFSPHVMNESHREVALSMLQLVLAELRSAQ
ncbi:hypothetical protein DSM43518_03205 [Mycobacterium marinum]|nr:hypothetical protein DSM43518_03205 [Mycobacterium marinum]BBC69113.1 hypothetical protein MMRN_p0820 [Mycobacterium marinum]